MFGNFQEWLLGTSCLQTEEKERIMNFVFKKDAKSALVSSHISTHPTGKLFSLWEMFWADVSCTGFHMQKPDFKPWQSHSAVFFGKVPSTHSTSLNN